LIDAGISAKQIVNRLCFLGKDPSKIEGIFVTHEHSDHIRGCDVFSRKFNVPIFATKGTSDNCLLCSDNEHINLIRNNEVLKIGGMEIEAFTKSHRAVDPVSYNISNGKKISIITDVGYACDNVISNVTDSDLLCIESNHDIEMLENGPYPYFLKKWIKSDIGHLSNNQAANCVLENGSSKLKYIILSHLSQKNNTPECVLSSFSILKNRKNFNPKLIVSQRERPTEILKI